MTETLIQLMDIKKSYCAGNECQLVLNELNLTVNRGELVSIMGQSGSGKSTLMNIIGLLDPPDSGKYYFKNENIIDFDPDKQAYTRNRMIGFVFQSFSLLPRMSAMENVALPLIYCGTDKHEMTERAMTMLEKVNLADKAKHKPNELSGGQQQRVAIARALVNAPDLILADEPTGALDPRIGGDVLDLFIHLNEEEKKTLIIITHDPSVAQKCQTRYQLVAGILNTA